MVTKQEPSPSSDSTFNLIYPPATPSRNSSPIYAQSIGVAMASPNPNPKPLPKSAPAPPAFNPFDVDDEPLAPSTVPFLASGKFNPTFISI
ncbi:hypothetical protein Moror_673 [Moniliophthora roreri MCA 2997]|uniref:Uncharacterized protein n=1 Tax=Moniliophthora roreri (strain MCA 2997) TaxID=1381753 RepID=V2WNX8_MONRO|nr:hypothetical protein Moror_673 [Moniliophthora roreri MCA 2997]